MTGESNSLSSWPGTVQCLRLTLTALILKAYPTVASLSATGVLPIKKKRGILIFLTSHKINRQTVKKKKASVLPEAIVALGRHSIQHQ